jgi:hypothetical protein
MTKLQKRNKQILKRVEDGAAYAEVADEFRLSVSRIRILVKDQAAKEGADVTRTAMRNLFVKYDNLDFKWPIADLIETIGPMKWAKSALQKHFIRGIEKPAPMSLRDLMEMIVPENESPFSPPLMHVPNIGKYGFFSIVHQLNAMDMGTKCNAEWKQRLAVLRERWKIKGKLPYHGEPD